MQTLVRSKTLGVTVMVEGVQQGLVLVGTFFTSPTPGTHILSQPHKRQRTDSGSTHSNPGTPRATQHDAPDPPASAAPS